VFKVESAIGWKLAAMVIRATIIRAQKICVNQRNLRLTVFCFFFVSFVPSW